MTVQQLLSGSVPSETGIVHVGYGAFHRAHQAVYLDRYMDETGDLAWGIAAVNLRAADAANFAAEAKNPGYILRTIAADGSMTDRLVRSHREFLDWSKDAEAAVNIFARDAVKAMSITVTEAGYFLSPEGGLDLTDPALQDELAGKGDMSVYAYIRGALKVRQQANVGGLTILCCDNIRENGHMLQSNFYAYLEAAGDQDLLAWSKESVTFPCSMVDRITPQPTADIHADAISGRDIQVGSTVHAEDFIQWVIEDKFANDFPALSKVGAIITPDVEPYEETKIRVLNGGHTCLAYLGALNGDIKFDETMRDETSFQHFQGFETSEVLRALPKDLPFDVEDYLQTVTRRFTNRHIGDSVERICSDGFAKFPQFIRPTIEGCLKDGHVPEYGIRSIASWYHFTRLSLAGKVETPYREPNIERLTALVGDGNVEDFAESEYLWGSLSRDYPRFKDELAKQIRWVESAWPAH